MTTLKLDFGDRGYDITVGSGIIDKASEYMNLNRKVFIVTDTGVPKEYSEKIKLQSENAVIFTVQQGEISKSLSLNSVSPLK